MSECVRCAAAAARPFALLQWRRKKGKEKERWDRKLDPTEKKRFSSSFSLLFCLGKFSRQKSREKRREIRLT